jgi:hypothetical protein
MRVYPKVSGLSHNKIKKKKKKKRNNNNKYSRSNTMDYGSKTH